MALAAASASVERMTQNLRVNEAPRGITIATALAGALATTLFATTLGAQQMRSDIPVNAFARPSGPYAVGMFDTLLVDASRPERYTKNPDDKRKLPVRIWYPAETVPNATLAPYVLRPEEFAPNSPMQSLLHVRTNSVVGAPVAKAERRYPVLIYNHGAGQPRFSATFVTEFLASYGYVVVAIDHPGMDQTVLFSDGSPFRPDTLRVPPPDPSADARASLARQNDFLNTVAFPMWIEDSRFVLDQVEAMNRAPGPLQGRLDLDRIGAFGWSMGGAAALELLRVDPRVKVAVNHDGRLFGSVMSEPIKRPFMMFHHGINDLSQAPEAVRDAARENLANIFGLDSAAHRRATADWYDVTIARTNHGHFSDLPLFMTLFKDTTLLAGPRDHEIITAYTLAFFERYFRGKQSDLLAKPSPKFPEVTFSRSGR